MKSRCFSAAFSFPREAQRDTLPEVPLRSPPEPFPQYWPPRCHMPDSAYTGNQSGYIMTPSRRGPRPLDASQQQRSQASTVTAKESESNHVTPFLRTDLFLHPLYHPQWCRRCRKTSARKAMPASVCHTAHVPYIVALRLSGDMQSHPGRKALLRKAVLMPHP